MEFWEQSIFFFVFQTCITCQTDGVLGTIFFSFLKLTLPTKLMEFWEQSNFFSFFKLALHAKLMEFWEQFFFHFQTCITCQTDGVLGKIF